MPDDDLVLSPAEPGRADAILDDELPDFSFAQLDKTQALASIEVLYQPIWNRKHQVIANYFATASARNAFGERIWGDALRAEYAGILTPAEFDIFVARRVLGNLDHLQDGVRSLIGWPVHFETLATRAGQQAYLELCRDIPEAVRKLLVLELDGLPTGAPSSRLLDILGVLRPFCRELIIRVPADFKRFDLFSGFQFGGVGFSLSGVEASDRQRIAWMNHFVAAAAMAGLRSYVHGLSNRAQVLAAMAAGFEWINGATVERPVDLPGPMMRFDLADLYRGL